VNSLITQLNEVNVKHEEGGMLDSMNPMQMFSLAGTFNRIGGASDNEYRQGIELISQLVQTEYPDKNKKEVS